MKTAVFLLLGLGVGLLVGFLLAGLWDKRVEEPDYGPPLEPDGDDSQVAA